MAIVQGAGPGHGRARVVPAGDVLHVLAIGCSPNCFNAGFHPIYDAGPGRGHRPT